MLAADPFAGVGKMVGCLCDQCSTTPAPTWTEAHRAWTEAKLVAALPQWRRRGYYAGVAKRRSEEAAKALARSVGKFTRETRNAQKSAPPTRRP